MFTQSLTHDSVTAHMQADYAVLILDIHGYIQYLSNGAVVLLGTHSRELLHHHITNLIPAIPLNPQTVNNNLKYLHAWSKKETWHRIKANAQQFSARIDLTTLGDLPLVILELRDSDANQTDMHLQQLIVNLDDSEEILVVTDTMGKFEYVNRAFERITGYAFEEVIGHTFEHIMHGDNYTGLYTKMWDRLDAGNSFRGVFLNITKYSQTFYEERYARPFINSEGKITNFIFTGQDVTKRVTMLQRLEHLAYHDELTGLPNRHLFVDRLNRLHAYAARAGNGFTLLCLDVDNLKSINDHYGHSAGDVVLVAVAKRLVGCIREEDTVARLGGDEFAVLLAGITEHVAVKIVLEKILASLREPVMYSRVSLPTHVSIGVAHYPLHTQHPELLLNLADMAMYNAKAAGGNGYYYTHDFSSGDSNDDNRANVQTISTSRTSAADNKVTQLIPARTANTATQNINKENIA